MLPYLTNQQGDEMSDLPVEPVNPGDAEDPGPVPEEENGEAEVDTETDADEGDQPAEDGSEDEVIA